MQKTAYYTIYGGIFCNFWVFFVVFGHENWDSEILPVKNNWQMWGMHRICVRISQNLIDKMVKTLEFRTDPPQKHNMNMTSLCQGYVAD